MPVLDSTYYRFCSKGCIATFQTTRNLPPFLYSHNVQSTFLRGVWLDTSCLLVVDCPALTSAPK